MNEQKTKSLIIGGALLAGIGVGAYYLYNRYSPVSTESDMFSAGASDIFGDSVTSEYTAGGGTSAMDNTNSILSSVFDSIFKSQRDNEAATQAAYQNYLMTLQPSDEKSDALQTSASTAVYGDNYEKAKVLFDSYISNGATIASHDLQGNTVNYTFGGYSSLNEAVKAGDNTAIQAYGEAAGKAARAVYGDAYDRMTPSQQSALLTNILHGKIDTASMETFAKQGMSVSQMTNEEVYKSALAQEQARSTTGSSTGSHLPSSSTYTKEADTSYHEKKSAESQKKSASGTQISHAGKAH